MVADTDTIAPASINKIMELCRYLRSDMGKMFIKNMADFLESLPTTLVEEAEKAKLTEQQDYFDIITLLNRDSDQVHLGMNAAMTICIEEFIHYVKNADKASSAEEAGSLSLIDTDDIEVTIMIEGLAGRISSKLSETMSDAFLRIKQLVPSIQQATALPFHPRALIQAMLDSMSTLSLNTAQKVILAKQFTPFIDHDVLEEIIRQSLTDVNIPEYDKTIKNLDHSGKSQQRTPPSQDQANAPPHSHATTGMMPPAMGASGFAGAGGNIAQPTSNNTTMGGPTFHEQTGGDTAAMAALQDAHLSAALSAHHHDTASGNAASSTARIRNSADLMSQLGQLKELRKKMSTMPVMPSPKNPMVTEQPVASQTLNHILAEIQQEQPTTSVREDMTIQSVGQIRSEIRSRLRSDEDTVQTIEDKDSDVINLVSLMFDYILDNPNLPTAMKALLARLQIPMLRVALLTPSFFAESNHPARQLLDSLSKAGISWDKAADKDHYYDKLESIVFRVLKEFSDDLSIFDTLLAELKTFLTNQEKQAEKIEQRTKTNEEKRAQTEISKNYVQKQLNERLIGKKLPFAVVKILQNGWWHVLYHTVIRHGRDSHQWKNALKVVDALVWSVLPPLDEKEQWLEQVNKIQLKLLENLRKGLTQVNFDPLQKTQLLHEIEQIHTSVIQERQIEKVDVALESTQTTEAALSHSLKKAGDQIHHAEPTTTDHSEPSTITLPNNTPLEPKAEVNQPIDKVYTDLVKQMSSGTWVEFKADTDDPQRCKLVAKIRALDKLVFTNRRGIKVAEVGQSKLARQLASGKARIIEEDQHIVQTALNSVVNDVESLESKGTPSNHDAPAP